MPGLTMFERAQDPFAPPGAIDVRARIDEGLVAVVDQQPATAFLGTDRGGERRQVVAVVDVGPGRLIGGSAVPAQDAVAPTDAANRWSNRRSAGLNPPEIAMNGRRISEAMATRMATPRNAIARIHPAGPRSR